jgi:hypothetical protein
LISTSDYTYPTSADTYYCARSVTGTAPALTDHVTLQLLYTSDIDAMQDVTLYVYSAQVEKSPNPTSFIPTTTASATRNTETLKYAISGNLTASQATISLSFMVPYGNGVATSKFLFDTDTKSRQLYLESSTGYSGFRPNSADSAGCSQLADYAFTANTPYVFSCTMKSAGDPNASFYIDGSSATAASNTDYTENAWGAGESFYVGSSCWTGSGNNHADSIIKGIHIYNRPLTSTEVTSDEGLFSS